MIDPARHVRYGTVGFNAEDLAAGRVDRHNRSVVAMLAQNALGARSQFCLVGRCTDQRDAPRGKQRLRER